MRPARQPDLAMPISPFLGDQRFDPETVRAMGVAFERACQSLRLAEKTDPATKLVAERIITAAERGERDPDSLCAAALASRGRHAT